MRNRLGMIMSLLLVCLGLEGSVETVRSLRTGDAISEGSTILVEDFGLYQGTGSGSSVLGRRAVVKLYFTDAEQLYRNHDWTMKVSYTLEYDYPDGSSGSLNSSVQMHGDLAHSGTTKSIDLDMYQGMSRIKVTIDTVMYRNLNSFQQITDIPEDFHFEVALATERYYELVSGSKPSIVNSAYQSSDNTLDISWSFLEGAESYELEWVYVADGNASGGNHLSAGISYDFKNATRISLNDQCYNIPLSYPKGSIIYRVRGVGRDLSASDVRNSLLYSDWTYQPSTFTVNQANSDHSTTPCHYYYSGIDNDKNWTYTATYAEDGKRKEIASYADGSGRTRQMVTVINSEGVAIVGESVYDYVGRPMVNILPVPTANAGIKFYGTAGSPFNGDWDRDNFATDAHLNESNAVMPEALPSTAGANVYYSSANPMDFQNKEALPDAEGYPYVLTQYSNDGTERLRVSSGLGDTLRYRADGGHNTRNYYGTPTQVELDRLFSLEAGDARYYQKVITIDPNGQQSVQYLDAHGRVIATALAGDEPATMTRLDNNSAETVNTLLFSGPLPAPVDGDIIQSQNYLSTSFATVSLDYYLDTVNFVTCRQGDSTINSSSAYHIPYEVEIVIRNDRGDSIKGWSQDSITSMSNVGVLNFNPLIGRYSITRRVKMNETAMEAFLAREDSLMDLTKYDSLSCGPNYRVSDDTLCAPIDCDSACVISYSYRVDSVLYYLDTAGNIYEPDSLGQYFTASDSNTTYTSYLSDTSASSPFADAIKACKQECLEFTDTTNQEGEALFDYFTEERCLIKSEILSAQMSPGGQYFDNTTGDFTYDTLGNSTYTPDTTITCEDTPEGYVCDTVIGGTRTNAWLNEHLPAGLDSVNSNFGTGFSTWDSLRGNWDPSYRYYMRRFHPEYCAYEYFCNYSYECSGQTITMDSIHWFAGAMYRVDSLSNSVIDGGNYDVMDPLNLSNTVSTTVILEDQSAYIQEQSGSTSIDPLVCTGAATTNLGGYADSALAGYLQHFMPIVTSSNTVVVNNGDTAYYSIWYVLDDPDGIADGNSGNNSGLQDTIVELFNLYHGDGDCWPGLIQNDEDKLAMFRNVYLFYREKVMYDFFRFKYKCSQTGELYSYWDADTNYDGIIDDSTHYALAYPKDPVFELYGAPMSEQRAVFEEVVGDPVSNQVLSARDTCSRDSLISYLVAAELYDAEQEIFLASSAVILDSINTRFCLNYSTTQTDSLMLMVSDQNYRYIYLLPEDLRCGVERSFLQDSVDQCSARKTLLAHQEAERQYQLEKAAYLDSLKAAYVAAAYQGLDSNEQIWLSYSLGEYHYTLYYYDRAGNLIKTVPPAGTTGNLLSASEAEDVDVFRQDNSQAIPQTPEYTYVTNYRYNAQNQLISQFTPDGDSTLFWYDYAGRLVVSQNAKQKAQSPAEFSYTIYDGLSRIVEVGQLGTSDPMQDSVAATPDLLKDFIYQADYRQQITFTLYDQTLSDLNPGAAKSASVALAFNSEGQEFLRNRVASTFYLETLGTNFDTAFVYGNERMDSLPIQYLHYSTASHYSYDPHGNVNRYVQEIDELDSIYGHGFFSVDYEYDLVSGNVNKVAYQAGEVDQFYHRYSYDADNRIRTVYTSPDDITYSEDARYFYYPHGPLSRMELGGQNVQGLDYAYTLQGWLKSVNGASLGENKALGSYDLGADARAQQIHGNFGADAFAYQLDYYSGDYQGIGTTNFTASISGGSNPLQTGYKRLFNGNIGRMITAINDNAEDPMAVSANLYQYDQLNRIASFVAYEDTSLNRHNQSALAQQMGYRASYSYDPNGNLDTLMRYNASGSIMDSLYYHYPAVTGEGLRQNRLKYVDDLAGVVNTVDLGDQGSSNYAYDAIGNLIKDVSNGIETINWNVQGKIQSIYKSGHYINFMYDPMGNRVKKEDTEDSKSTYYVRDAQGNVMATYVDSGATFKLSQQMLYGSNRLGLRDRELSISSAYTTTASSISGVAKGLYLFNSKGSANTIYVNPNSSPGTYWLEAVEGQVKVESTVTPLAGTYQAITGYYLLEEGDYIVYSSTGDDIISSGRFKLQSDEDFSGVGFAGTYHLLNPQGEELGLKNYELSNHLGNVLSTVSDRKIWKAYEGLEYTLRSDSFPNVQNSSSLTTSTEEWGVYAAGSYGYEDLGGSILFESANEDYLQRVFEAAGTCNYEYCLYIESEQQVRITITETSGSNVVVNQYITTGSHCFDISQYGSGEFTVDLYPTAGAALQVSTESVSQVTLPANYEDAYGCTGSTSSGGLTLDYVSGAGNQHQISTQEAIDADCDQELCFTISDLSGAGQLVTKDQNGSTISTTAISTNGQHCVSYSSTSADSLTFIFSMTSGTGMTLKDLSLIQSCDQTLQVANVLMAQDYYPFGMVMPGRNYIGGYRFGFNGMEQDEEIKGEGNSYTTEFRQYDPRIGSWLSLDPAMAEYPNQSPYIAFNNNPIFFTDPRGDDPPEELDDYEVKEGDNLTNIAKENGVSVEDLVKWNNISDPDYIQVGQKLTVSDPNRWTYAGNGFWVDNQKNDGHWIQVDGKWLNYEVEHDKAVKEAQVKGLLTVGEGMAYYFTAMTFSAGMNVLGALQGFGPAVATTVGSTPRPNRLPNTRISFVNGLNENPRSIWGKTVEQIATEFRNAGYKVTVEASTKKGTSMLSTQIRIQGHSEITNIQVHPGGGRHGGAYYKISTSTQGRIKVVNRNTYKPIEGDKSKVIYIDE